MSEDHDTKLLQALLANKTMFQENFGPIVGNTIYSFLEELQLYKQQIQAVGFAVDHKSIEAYRHTKGNEYLLLKADNVKLEATWSDGVLYASKHEPSLLIIRDKKEFMDGRFTKIDG
jgi:hypothetical protein